jgi:pimeloyl-ACP methyl ester carboxylesterase
MTEEDRRNMKAPVGAGGMKEMQREDPISKEGAKWKPVYPVIETENIRVNGTELSYIDRGTGRTVVFLHGALATKESWEYQIESFSECSRAVAPDFRGHGASGPGEGEHSVHLYTSDVIALLDDLGVDKAVFCGHSMGGFVAQEIALTHPERVDKLILVDTSYGIKTTVGDRIKSGLAHLYMELTAPEKLIKAFADAAGKHSEHTRAYMYWAMNRYRGDKELLMRIWNAVETFDSKERLDRIEPPTLIVSPEKNSQAAGQARYMNEIIPNSERVIVPAAGHMVMMDNSSGFNRVLEEF